MATSVQPVFHANWPKTLDPALRPTSDRVIQLFQKALYYLLFPLTFTWSHFQNLACRTIMPGIVYIDPPSSLFGVIKILARLFFNANAYKADLSTWARELLTSYGGKKIYLKTPDNILIQGAFFETKGSDRVVIVSGGNATQWEGQKRWLEILKPLGVSVMLLNPRGIGSSYAHRSPEGWALDFYTACQYLIKEKSYNPESVLPLGYSMGGATSARGAALVQEEYPDSKIPCMNLCSFSDLSKEVSSIMKGILGSVANLALRVLKIRMPVHSKLKTLKGEKVVMYKPADRVIPFPASMTHAVAGDEKTRIISLLPGRGHGAELTPKEITTIQYEVRRLLGMRQPLLSFTRPLTPTNA